MEQTINGNNNIVAGRDVNLKETPDFPSNNPNIIDCPQCWLKTGRHSQTCNECGYPVAEHFEVIRIQKHKKQQREAGKFSTALGIIGMLLVNYVIPDALDNTQMVIGSLSLIFIAGGFKLITDNQE